MLINTANNLPLFLIVLSKTFSAARIAPMFLMYTLKKY